MSSTPNLGLGHILASQSQKEVTANQSADGLDEAIAGTTTLDVTAGGTFTLTSGQWINMRLKLIGSPGAGVTVIVPLANPKLYVVDNECGQNALVKGSSGTGITIATGKVQILYCDGTNVIAINPPASSGVISYGIGTFLSGGAGQTKLLDGQYVEVVIPWVSTLAANFAGSVVAVGANPTASSITITVKKNGSAIGTIVITSGGGVTLATSGGLAQSLAINDVIELLAPNPADATLDDVTVTLVATR